MEASPKDTQMESKHVKMDQHNMLLKNCELKQQ